MCGSCLDDPFDESFPTADQFSVCEISADAMKVRSPHPKLNLITTLPSCPQRVKAPGAASSRHSHANGPAPTNQSRGVGSQPSHRQSAGCLLPLGSLPPAAMRERYQQASKSAPASPATNAANAAMGREQLQARAAGARQHQADGPSGRHEPAPFSKVHRQSAGRSGAWTAPPAQGGAHKGRKAKPPEKGQTAVSEAGVCVPFSPNTDVDVGCP